MGWSTSAAREAEAGLESIDADCIALDEHDLLVQAHIPVAERRIGASSLGLIRRIGFPTISEYGIHAEFCVTPETKILTGDLRYVEAGALRLGDRVLGFEEENVSARGRRFESAEVTDVGRTTLPCVRVRTSDGIEVVVSADHRWLVWSGNGLRWRRTAQLRLGERICSVGRWAENEAREAGWLAGVFDGEGSVSGGRGVRSGNRGNAVTVAQKEGPVLNRIRAALTAYGYGYSESERKGCVSLYLKGGVTERLRFLGEIRPERLLRQAEKVWGGVNVGAAQKVHVVALEEVGAREVVTLGTSTGTFIAEGLLSHNCKSDQREWHVKCEHCGEWQPITWAANVDVELGIRVCAACRKPVDVAIGEWVAKYPDRDTKGYHTTKLLVPRQEIMPRLIAASKETLPYKRQVFFNRDLGEPHEAEGARLTPALIAACTRRELVQQGGYGGQNPVFMGVDIASTRNLNAWVSERYDDDTARVLWVGEVDSFDALSRMMETFRVSMACVDHLPEGRLARAFAERFVGRVYVVNYATAGQLDVLKIDATQRRASVRRTESLDAAFDRIRGQRELLPTDLPEGFVEQMCANVRSVERDDVGRITVAYRSTGADDYAQALAYSVVAAECYWIQEQVAHSAEVTSIDEIEGLGFERSTLGDYDAEDEYSPGRDDGGYALNGENGYGEY